MNESMDIPEGYKATELGVLPKEWSITNLGDISKIRGGYGFSPDFQGKENEKFPFFKVSDMNSIGNEIEMITANNYVGEEVILKISAKLFPKNTIIFPKVGGAVYTNKKRILVRDSLIDNNLMGVTSNSDTLCSPDFLLFYFLTLELRDLSNPGPLPSINGNRVKSLYLPLPPLPEQHAIATTLRTVQEAKEKTDAVIAATKALKAAMMKHLFTYGPVPPKEAERVVLKESEIGLVPEGWKINKLKEISNIFSGGTPSKENKDFWIGNIPWVSPKDLKMPKLSDVVDHISKEGLVSGSRLVPEGTIFIVIRGMILIRDIPVAIITKPMAFNQDLKAICAIPNVNPTYLLYAISQFKSNLLPEIGTSAHGTKRIGTSAIENLLVPLPSEDEQKEIVDMIEAVEKKLTTEQSRKEALDTLFASLLHDLMTAKIRVKNIA